MLIVASPQQRLKDLLGRTTDYETQTSGEVYQEVHLRHKVAEQETVKKFSMLNLVAGSIHDSPLATWAASKKLFPWVAVAAPMEVRLSGIVLKPISKSSLGLR